MRVARCLRNGVFFFYFLLFVVVEGSVLVFEVYIFAYNPYIAFLLIYRILKMDCKHEARGVSFFV